MDNRGEGELSYGIAIHPYFSKREQEVKISVPAASVMEMTEEKIPTGKLIPAGETVPDLRTPVLVDGLSLDHVYTDCPAGAYAEIFYKDCKVKTGSNGRIWPYCCIYAGCAVFLRGKPVPVQPTVLTSLQRGMPVSQGFRRFMQGRKSPVKSGSYSKNRSKVPGGIVTKKASGG